uniref:Protein translocase subunit SecY n=1 Tax=Boldia erythrosiphon TaxID=74908 RepID=A0A1Y9TLU6_9RHOD|nr:preprotein translocase secY subunit [Boldia erythrosiphon]ARO90598.1 preprotein translocase secY subunit [Boldia erythrosiphon]
MKKSISFKILTNKIILTISLLIFSRIGVFIPIPGLDHAALYHNSSQNGLVNFLNVVSGGGFSTLGIFTLGIGPYINSSIMMQALTKILPNLKKLREEGGSSYKKINQIIRNLAILLAIIQSITITLWIRPYVFDWNIYFIMETTISLTTGSIIIMWVGELITDSGIGSGQSLLIFQNIVASIASTFYFSLLVDDRPKELALKPLGILFLSFVIMTFVTIYIQQARRKIGLISTRQLGKNITIDNYLPIKFNYLGVMPLVLSSGLINILDIQLNILLIREIQGIIFYYCLIICFSYVQLYLVLDPEEMANNLKKMGTTIPLIRSGEATIKYLKGILNQLTFLGANYLAGIACIPYVISRIAQVNDINGIRVTTLFILISVAIEIIKEFRAYNISQKYENIINN